MKTDLVNVARSLFILCFLCVNSTMAAPPPDPQPAPQTEFHFRSFTEEIVLDELTGLSWQGVGIEHETWEDAISYCEGLDLGDGFNDWRLPNIKELKSIISIDMINPAIDDEVFSWVASDYYWSSTTYLDGGENESAWTVYFEDGSIYPEEKTNTNYVRCVRGGI